MVLEGLWCPPPITGAVVAALTSIWGEWAVSGTWKVSGSATKPSVPQCSSHHTVLPPRLCSTPQRSATASSNGDGGNCVEVRHDLPGFVPVRDSKTPAGPALVFPVSAWAPFVGALKGDGAPTG